MRGGGRSLPASLPVVAPAALLLVALAAGLAGALVGVDAVDQLAWLPPCPFRALAGLPCPGCGMTRALLLLGQLRVAEALAMHPLVPGLVLAALWGAIGGPGRARIPRDAAATTLLALVVGVWGARLWLGAAPPA